jgi:hypothetical protein
MQRKPTPKEFNEFLAFLHLFLPYRAIEGVLRALERLKIIPTSLEYQQRGKSKKHEHKIRGK